MCGMQAPTSCCSYRGIAAWAGHYDSYRLLTPYGTLCETSRDPYSYIRLAVHRGNVEFAKQLLDDMPMQPFRFAEDCLRHEDVVSLQFVLGAVPGLDLEVLCRLAGFDKAVVCLRFLLERGVPWNHYSLLYPARDNRLDILELVLPLTNEWCPLVPTVAACVGHVRFLMRVFDAGCPTWARANDGEPMRSWAHMASRVSIQAAGTNQSRLKSSGTGVSSSPPTWW
jgi:hypothetical protein